MRIYAVVLTNVATPDQPFLVDARDAAMVEDNPAGWRYTFAQAAIGADVHAAAEFVLEVPTDAVLAVLRTAPPVLPAEAVAPDQLKA